MQPYLHILIYVTWIGVGIVWAIGAVATKRTAQVQSPGSRLIHVSFVAAAFALLFAPGLAIGPLGWRFVPDSAVIAYTGLALTLGGAALAVWARIFLGRNWSAVVTIREDHQIVQTGPYAVVRHPIYSGGLLAMLGTALAFGELRELVALGLAFMAWWFKSRLEERFMEQRFGAEYVAYKQRVKALIPMVL